MSDFEFRPIQNFFRVLISCKKNSKNTNTDIIALHIYIKSPYKVTFSLGSLGYCKTNATFHFTHERAYKVNTNLKLLDNS